MIFAIKYKGKSNELIHRSHKYTKKVYKNGYWRYYYGYDKSSNPVERIADKLGYDERMTAYAASRNKYYAEDYYNHVDKVSKDPKYSAKNVQDFIQGTKDSARKDVKREKLEWKTQLNKYKSTPLYKIDKTIDEGKDYVEKVSKGKIKLKRNQYYRRATGKDSW